MNDSVKEAFEAWAEQQRLPTMTRYGSYISADTNAAWRAWQAVLQQTAPAVPEGWMLVPEWASPEMQNAGADARVEGEAAAGIYRAMLTAAPSPDHSGDANRKGAIPFAPIQCGQPDSPYRDNENMKDHIADAVKVVGDHYDLGVALSRHFDELRDSETGHIAFDPCDSNDIDEVLAIINAHLSSAPTEAAGKMVQGKALEWSEPQKPNNECSYDHVIATTPFGRFLITWKSWKEYNEPAIDETPWGEFGGVGCDLDDAKKICENEYFARLRSNGGDA